MSNIAKRISAVALSVVLALGMCPAVAFAAPDAQQPAQEPQAVEAPEAEAAEAAAPEATPAAEEPVILEATASEEGPSLNPDIRQVTIYKTMSAYDVDPSGNRKLVAYENGVANKTRTCGNAGYCELVSPSDGSAPTTYPYSFHLEAFALGCSNGYRLAAFNVTYTDRYGQHKKTVQNGELKRLGDYNPAKTTYEFTVPDANDITVNAVWEKQTVAISKSLVSPFTNTDGSETEAGTCMMVATKSGIPATKYPAVGNQTAFRITTKAGYKLVAFNVAYTDKSGKKVRLTNGAGLTRVGAYSATSNTYEFTVPDAKDISVNVMWVYSQVPQVIASGKEGSNITWQLCDNGLVLINGTGAMIDHKPSPGNSDRAAYITASENLNVPIKAAQIGEGITSIGDYAFVGARAMKSVSVPSTVTRIGDYAFCNTQISSIALPAGLKTIGTAAFNATGLTSVTVPDGIQTIGNSAFCISPHLKTVKIGEGLQTLESGLFAGCSSLTSVTLPNSLKEIKGSVFSECTALTTLNIPAGVESIPSNAFWKCTNLKSFTVDKANANIYSPDGRCLIMKYGPISSTPSGNTYGSNVLCAYAAASGSSYSIPSGVEIIASSVFINNTMLKFVTIPSTVTTIRDSAFMGCTGLTTVTIPKSVTQLGNAAFMNCTNLRTASVPLALYVPGGAFPDTCTVTRY